MKTPTPFDSKAGVQAARQHDTTDLVPGLLRAFVTEVITAAPWLALGFALGAVIEAAAAVWRAM